jgi:hypothetical protein
MIKSYGTVYYLLLDPTLLASESENRQHEISNRGHEKTNNSWFSANREIGEES